MLYMSFVLYFQVQNEEATVVVAGLGTAVAALASRCKKLPWRPVRGNGSLGPVPTFFFPTAILIRAT